MTNERLVLVHQDTSSLATSVAARFIAELVEVLRSHGTANVVLTGGRMGSAVLSAVNGSPVRDTVDWKRVSFWWGDERWLPRGDAERNETQARAALLDHLDIPASSMHPFAASDDGIDLDTAVERFTAELAANSAEGSTLPRFDIVFLGVGPDGHIASLFPEHRAILEETASVVAERNSPKPPAERLSLTLPVINSAARVWMVIAGADKASALGLTLAGASLIEVPAAGAEGREQTILFVDRAATTEVPENLTATEIFWTADDSTDLH